jgi:hypothetical protein
LKGAHNAEIGIVYFKAGASVAAHQALYTTTAGAKAAQQTNGRTYKTAPSEIRVFAVACFVLTIHTRTIGFGENRRQENHAVAKILMDAAHRSQTGHGPIPLKDNANIDVAEYAFGEGMRNHIEA